jgi:hypothetical protein
MAGTNEEQNLMRTLPVQPMPFGAVQPIVYVREKTDWQYKQIIRSLSEGMPNEDELNQLGKDGWELVSVLTHGGVAYLYFKRIKA